MMSNINISSEDISLIKQNNQRRYIKLQVLNREMNSVGTITGRLVDCNISIDGSDGLKRTANITIETETDYLKIPAADISIDLQRDMPANYYIKVWAGIEDNNTLRTKWYSQGIFIIAENSYNYDPTTRTLSMSLSDLLTDLNGDRGGELHAYTTIAKNSQRIDDAIKNVLNIVGIKTYTVEPVTILRPVNTPIDTEASEKDFYVPEDINFSVGVTAYEILEKLVHLYPYYEMGFDADGVFYVRRELLDQDDSFVMIDAETLTDLVISEDTSIDNNYIKNHIEVWGRDGNYYGEAKDTNPESPFQVNSTPLRVLVVKDNEYGVDTNNIYDRYTDTKLAAELLKQQGEAEEKIALLESKDSLTQNEQEELQAAKSDLANIKVKQDWNISISGNELAEEWAQRILYDRTRMQDSITITTVFMPFINDVGFKISYRSKIDNIVKTYVIKSVNHNASSGTTSIEMIRFYNDMCSNYWNILDKPVIVSAVGIGMDIVIDVTPVQFAEKYILFLNNKKVAEYTGTSIIYSVPAVQKGTYDITISAEAPYYRSSLLSEPVTVTVKPLPVISDILITDEKNRLITNSGAYIKYNEG